MKYLDKHGKKICHGTKIRYDSGEIDLVYDLGNGKLGVNASNEKYLQRVYGGNKELMEAAREFYPLTAFPQEGWPDTDIITMIGMEIAEL